MNIIIKLKELWNKTILSDMVNKRKERKRFEREILQRAENRFKPEYEKILEERMYKDMVAKAKGLKPKKSNVLEKIGNEMMSMGRSAGSKDLGGMMGYSNTNTKKDIGGMMGMGKNTNVKVTTRRSVIKKKKQNNPLDVEDKIRRMLE